MSTILSQKPFLWISAFGFVLSVVVGLVDRRTAKFAVNGALICLLFWIAEAAMQPTPLFKWMGRPSATGAAIQPAVVATAPAGAKPALAEGTHVSNDYFRDDYLLGFAGRPNARFHYSVVKAGKLLYDTEIDLDQDGLRVLPRPIDFAPDRAVLFFGDSFVFGLGVRNEEVFAAQFQAAVGGKVRAVNLGFQGHGAHQMLRRLETGGEERHLGGVKPTLAVYLAREAHVDWAADRSGFDFAGPKYELDKSGFIYYAGHFQNPIWVKIKRRLEKSAVLSWFLKRYNRISSESSSRTHDIERYVAIVAKAKATLEERYPGLRFVTIFWEERGKGDNDQIVAALRARGVAVVTIGEIVPDYEKNRLHYVFDDGFGHPKPLGHHLLSQYLVTHAF